MLDPFYLLGTEAAVLDLDTMVDVASFELCGLLWHDHAVLDGDRLAFFDLVDRYGLPGEESDGPEL